MTNKKAKKGEPCEPYHISHPTPCLDCKKKDDRFHALESKFADIEKENVRLRDEITECVASAIELDILTIHDVKKWGEDSAAHGAEIREFTKRQRPKGEGD